MTSPEINGSPAAMSTFATGLTAPPMPPTLMARLGMPPNLTGLFESIAMALLDKAATVEVAAYLAKVTADMDTYSVKGNAASASYSTADLSGTLALISSGAKFVQQGISFIQQLTKSSSQNSGTSSAGSSTQQPGSATPGSSTQQSGSVPAAGAQQAGYYPTPVNPATDPSAGTTPQLSV